MKELRSLTATVLALNFHPAHILLTEQTLHDNYVQRASMACRFLIACNELATVVSDDWRILHAAERCVSYERRWLIKLDKRIERPITGFVDFDAVHEESFRTLADTPQDIFDWVYLEVLADEAARSIALHRDYIRQSETDGLTELAESAAAFLERYQRHLAEIREARFGQSY